MQRGWLGIVCVAVGLVVGPVAVASGLGTSTKVRVSPRSGGVHTKFTLRFWIPDATGSFGGLERSDSLVLSGSRRAGCVGGADLPLRAAAAHHTFTITLNPARLNAHWCVGTFTGSLIERETTTCKPIPINVSPPVVCPRYVVAPRVLARFHFTVTARARARRSRP